jgi:hypothetical protein
MDTSAHTPTSPSQMIKRSHPASPVCGGGWLSRSVRRISQLCQARGLNGRIPGNDGDDESIAAAWLAGRRDRFR